MYLPCDVWIKSFKSTQLSFKKIFLDTIQEAQQLLKDWNYKNWKEILLSLFYN